jgi:hypothetical protein
MKGIANAITNSNDDTMIEINAFSQFDRGIRVKSWTTHWLVGDEAI